MEFRNYGDTSNQAGRQTFRGTVNFNTTVIRDKHTGPIDKQNEKQKLELVQKIIAKRRNHRLKSLGFSRMEARHDAIKPTYMQTCEWLVSEPEVVDWMQERRVDQHHGFLWIKGKPGAGKSTATKFLLNSVSALQPEAVTVSFFFNARGENLEKSTTGMYRSLLAQVFEQIPGSQCLLDSLRPTIDYGFLSRENPEFLEYYLGCELDPIEWTLGTLKTMFSNVVRQLGDTALTCFVDALDECDEMEIRDMVEFFEELGAIAAMSKARVRFRTCFSSRHYPHITMDRCLSLVLEEQRGHCEDLAAYVNGKLRIGSSEMATQIKKEVLQRASGVFLWAVLVIQLLRTDFDRGHVHKLRDRLRRIPDGLEALFDDMLARDGEPTPELIICIQCVLHAQRSLRPEELYFAIHSWSESTIGYAWDHNEISQHDITRFILSTSKGLVEEVEANSSADPDSTAIEYTRTVQFVHETVREFLLGEWGFREKYFGPAHDFVARSHYQLNECCRRYYEGVVDVLLTESLSIAEIQPEVTEPDKLADRWTALVKPFPFLPYATDWMFSHIHDAHDTLDARRKFVDKLAIRIQVMIDGLSPVIHQRCSLKFSRALYKKDLRHLIHVITRGLILLDTRSSQYACEMYNASNAEADWVFELLIMRLISTEKDRAVRETNSHIAVNAEQMMVDFLRWHSSRKRIETHSQAFLQALHVGAFSVVRYFLYGTLIDVSIRVDHYGTALQSAAAQNRCEILKLLLQVNADVNLYGGYYGSALQAAAAEGHIEIVELLLQANANVNIPGDDYRTALQLAAMRGHSGIVELLLHAGADVNAHGVYGTALQAAADEGHSRVVELLLLANANVDASDDYYGTALYAAAEGGHKEVIELLLQANADVNMVVSGPHKTALAVAAAGGHSRVVELLLQANVDINIQVWGFRHIIGLAESQGHTETVNVLRNSAVFESVTSSGEHEADLMDGWSTLDHRVKDEDEN